VDLKLAPATKSLEIKCARFEARISGMDAEDFPPIPEIDEGTVARIDAEVFSRSLTRVVFAAATEDSRPVLTGVNADFDGKMVTLAAADGFRLSVDKIALLEPVAESVSVIIPARALTEVNRLIGDSSDPVVITVNPAKSQVLFTMDNVRLISQLVQGNFPNYSQLIPQGHSTRTLVDAEEFLRATRAASIFARDASGIVRLQVDPGDNGLGRLTISARAEEVGDDQGDIDAKVEGEEAKIAFNAKYLSDILSVLAKGEVVLETTNPSSPGLIRPGGDTDYVHVVMPMFVQW
ncbi:MAG: DNA polymerase III subunit beta, partial [Chloroflexi bacterium]|nr:DNA polymerase III subunit beta [Chloroflexota bacterium]